MCSYKISCFIFTGDTASIPLIVETLEIMKRCREDFKELLPWECRGAGCSFGQERGAGRNEKLFYLVLILSHALLRKFLKHKQN